MKSDNKTFISVDPKEASLQEVHKLLLGGVTPRPIALVSTISEDGFNNLSPFSFYNAFGANPPIVVFSPARRGRDGTTKDTLNNLQKIKECVVQAVSYEIIQQVSLASTEYDSSVDEFVKSGLTPIKSDLVQPMRVAESPFQMECKVQQIIPLGEKNGSGNLVVCEVVKIHFDEAVLQDGVIEPNLIRLVGRNSANYYSKAFDNAIFEIEKPIATKGIGIDQLPEFIKHSKTLTGNDLGQLGNIEKLPTESELQTFITSYKNIGIKPLEIPQILKENDPHKIFSAALSLTESDKENSMRIIEIAAKKALEQNDVTFAIHALLASRLILN